MANYTHLCWQGTVQCSPRGHRTREAADRCAARHNSVLRSLGLLTEPNRWIVRANPRRVEDIDYKDLFRDAVLMMAAMARAAGFDSKDENVEPPDIIARVENQRAEVERLTAERAELLAPARAVDVGAVLARANRLVPAFIDWDNLPSSVWAEVIEQITAAPIMARELIRASMERADMTAERATIVQALDDDCAPDIDGQQVKTLADRVNALLGHWQDEIRGALCAGVPDPHRIDGGGCDSGDPLDLTLAEVAQAVNQLTDRADERIAALTAERDAARGDAEERHLVLLAEQGRAEGAPSEGWQHQGLGTWLNIRTGAVVTRGGWPVTAPGESVWTLPNGTRGVSPNARAAMLAADKATP